MDPEKHIVINGRIYEREAFTTEQVQAISLVNFADAADPAHGRA